MDNIKVIVVDDHPMVLEGMKSMLAEINFVELIGLASNAYQAIELLKVKPADVLITDINLPEISGIELTAKIKKEFPNVKIIAMSTFKERSYISQMIQNGALGYLVKSASRAEIEDAIYAVSEGKLFLSLDVKIQPGEKEEMDKLPLLSSREKEILTLISEGMTNPQISIKLFISLHTVDSHRKNILTKFGVNNTASLIKLAAKYNWI